MLAASGAPPPFPPFIPGTAPAGVTAPAEDTAPVGDTAPEDTAPAAPAQDPAGRNTPFPEAWQGGQGIHYMASSKGG